MDELKFNRHVWHEIHKAYAWYLANEPVAASRFLDAFWRGVDEILDHPSSWPRLDDRHRYRLLRSYPFQIIYRLEFDRIHIVALAHTKRKSGYWKRRK